jgi:hypothetical protein
MLSPGHEASPKDAAVTPVVAGWRPAHAKSQAKRATTFAFPS